MSDQQVVETPIPSQDETQHTVCEDCGRVWIVECNNQDINLCFDNDKLEEISKPVFLLTVLQEKMDPFEVKVKSPAKLTCIVRLLTVPKNKYLYTWKVNHTGKGSAAYSGCKIDPALHCDGIKEEDSKISGHRDESITFCKPLSRKRKGSWKDKNDTRVDKGRKLSEIVDDGAEGNDCEYSRIRTDNVLENAGNIETDTLTYNTIQSTVYSENILETIKSEIDMNENVNWDEVSGTNVTNIDYNVDCAVKCEINDVKTEEVYIKNYLVDATDQCTDWLDKSFPILGKNIKKTKCLNSQIGKLCTANMKVNKKQWESTTFSQQHSQGFEVKTMQQGGWKQAPKAKSLIDPDVTKCICGDIGYRFIDMLECQRCKHWFHERCVGCLQYKLICGDRFYLYVCEFCNNGKEFLQRLPLDWDNIVHLALWNLSNSKGHSIHANYFAYEEQIICWVNIHWELLQCPSDLQNIPIRDRALHILSALKANSTKFMLCSFKRRKNRLWKLKLIEPPTALEIIVPSGMLCNIRHETILLTDNRTTELISIQKTFKVDAVGPL